jgi:hypothetical protein
VRLSRANATTLYALVEQQGVLNTTVTLTGSAAVALARNPRPATQVARRDPNAQQPYEQQAQPDEQQQYASTGQPVDITPQGQQYGQPYGQRSYAQERPDDGYIYPADGSASDQRYPAPTRRLFGAQAYQQQQYPQQQYRGYDNPAYAQPQPGAYYQPRQQYYQPRGYSQD